MKLKDILDVVFEDMEAHTMKFEPNKVYTNEIYKTFKLNEEAAKLNLVIMVGLPGAGKSTFIKKLPNPVVCSADHYFEKGGEYKFDVTKLSEAHRQCMNKAHDNMLMKKPTVVIDNTNLNDKERLPYEDMAEKLGYKIIYVVFEPNKQDIKKLAQRNLHGVDAAKLEIMSKKFRPPSGEKGKIIYK
jgi:predicted kinase